MKILVSTLSYDGKISGFSVDMFVRMFKSFHKQYDIAFNTHSMSTSNNSQNKPELAIDFFRPKNDLTNRARVQIINKAVREGYDYLLTIDEDNPISSIGLIHMLKTMKEARAGVVCAAVPSRIPVPYPGTQGGVHPKTGRVEPIIAAVHQSRDGGYKHYLPLREIPAKKTHEVDSCGTGCVLIDCRYLEKLIEKYGQYCCEFDTRRHLDIGQGKYTEIVTLDDGDDYVISIDGEGQKILTKIDSEMIPNTQKLVTPIGEDVLLMERLKQLGAKIVMDCHMTAKHWNEGSGFSKIGIGLMELPLEIFIPVYNVTPKIWRCIKDNLYLWRDLFENNNLMVTFIHDGPVSERKKAEFSKKLQKEYPLRREKGRIRVITYPQNKGVNFAWNFAQQSKAMNVLILNDDCIISSDSLKIMMQTLIENKEIGVISPMTKDKNTPNGDGMKFGNVAGRCFMMPTAVCSLVMPIDDRINLWYGDDWCFHSVKELGLEIAYAKGAVCEHLGSTTVGKPGQINPGIAKIIEKDKIGRVNIIQERGRIDKRFH